MPAPASLSALRLKRRMLEERIEELESGSARVEELGPDGFRDVTARTLVELHTELGRVGAAIHQALASLRKPAECSSCWSQARPSPSDAPAGPRRNRRARPREWLAKITIQ